MSLTTAQLAARKTKLEARLVKYEAALDEVLTGGGQSISAYGLSVTNSDPMFLQRQIDKLELEIADIENLGCTGEVGIIVALPRE